MEDVNVLKTGVFHNNFGKFAHSKILYGKRISTIEFYRTYN